MSFDLQTYQISLRIKNQNLQQNNSSDNFAWLWQQGYDNIWSLLKHFPVKTPIKTTLTLEANFSSINKER